MLANAWGDTVFPVNQYASFYEKLTVPKRLQLRPGDYATPELTGLFGLPNDVWTDTRRWFDHYLRGADNGVEREQPVRLKSRNAGGYEGYPDWKSVTATRKKIALAGSTTIRANVDSGADGGIVFLSSILDQVAQLPPVASLPLLPRRWAAVWQSERYGSAQRVRGTTTLHTTLTPTAESGTLVAHLPDVGPLGFGKLVTHAPLHLARADARRTVRRRPGAVLHGLRRPRRAPPRAGGRHGRPALRRAQPVRRAADLLLARGRPVVRVRPARRAVISGCRRTSRARVNCRPPYGLGAVGGTPPGSSAPARVWRPPPP